MSKSKVYSSLNPSNVYELKAVLGEGYYIPQKHKNINLEQ